MQEQDMRLGILTGLAEEAALAARHFPQAAIATSGATQAGAERALGALKAAGATHLLSFGYAGGLAPWVQAGSIMVPEAVMVEGQLVPVSAELAKQFGVVDGHVLHSPHMVRQASEKAALYERTGCAMADMESGLVVTSGLPAAVLRVACDVAGETLPPAACQPLRGNKPDMGAILQNVLRRPGQLPALITLGRHRGAARQAMEKHLHGLDLA
ncbi:hypothetical protein E3E12_06935 [Formicincola oecophyllae]|uniref:Nucleoside phosphorylase domain-containing protein n=1 Tax=Formicincola oecophyllae TaxID=2558361 RepID=A0A4Y6U926_9PROT|nr:hypothetical protein [Formicincola oecophyllae]QDH13959.1 hypothetical protein E3E12_06935 [Formicincola oecophyllae]